MKVEKLHLRLFLEGVEIPCVSATISMARDSAASAAIQIVPTPIAALILPRTLVHLFFLDGTLPTGVTSVPGSGQVEQINSTYQAPELREGHEPVIPDVPPAFTAYRLLFMGEVMAISYSKNAAQRSVVLHCQDLSNYWDSVMHDVGGGLFAPSRMARVEGKATGAFYDMLGGNTGALYDRLSKPPSSFPQLAFKDPMTGQQTSSYLGGVMHLLEEIFGTYHRRLAGGTVITSQNPFAAMAELRLRLMQQIGIPPGDSTPLRLMKSQGFGSLWRTSIRGLPRQFNFRMLMQSLMQYTFYSVYPLTTPFYRPPSGDYAKAMGWAREPGSVETPALAAVDYKGPIRALLEVAKELRSYLALSVGEFGASLDVRIRQESDIRERALGVFQRADSLGTSLCRQLQARGSNSPVCLKLSSLAYAGQNGRNVLLSAAATIPGPWIYLQVVIQMCEQILGLPATTSRRRPRQDIGQPAFLFTQLFRPDIWFCPPPRCNVLFPDFISGMSYSRNFFAEPTRLMIKGYSAFLGSVPFFDKWYFTPMAAGLLRDRPIIRRSGGSYATGDAAVTSDLMAHEIYTGIIPFFQKMSDREMTIGKHIMSAGGTAPASGEQLDYFQRVTNFLFFKTRFAARTISVQSRFDPWLVPGYPGLILDAPTNHIDTRNNSLILQYGEEIFNEIQAGAGLAAGTDLPQKGEILDLLKGRTGIHFLGMVESVTHQLDAAGSGGTSVVLSYGRDHREEIELFGQDVQTARKRRTLYRTVRRQVSVLEPVSKEYQEAALGTISDLATQMTEPLHTTDVGNVIGLTLSDWAQARNARLASLIARYSASLAPRVGTVEETVRGERITDKTWTVAAFADNPPTTNAGAQGPWGGLIKEVRDITDQFVEQYQRSPAADRETRNIDSQASAIDEQLATLPSSGGTPEQAAARTALLDRRGALRSRRGNLRQRASRPRTLSLFGVAHNGNRLTSTSIPASLIGTANPARSYGAEVVSYVGNPSTLVTLRAYEIVEDISSGADKIDYALEDIVRPPWFPAIWLNGRVGGGVYIPMIGTGAITDPLMVVRPGGLPTAIYLEAGSTEAVEPDVEESAQASPEVVGSIMHGATLEGAVDFLALTYSQIRAGGLDTADFCKQYVWRPIATLFDLFGSADLEISGDGTIQQGVEGFHSRAYGPYADLFGLAPADTSKLLGIDVSDVAAKARLDVRGRRRTVVQAYQRELLDRRVRSG